MATRELIAQALANAMLAGDWTRRDLLRRARLALGARPVWLGAVVRSVLADFPEPPRDRRDALASRIRSHPLFAGAFSNPDTAPRLRRLFVDRPAMGRGPWPVVEIATPGDLAAFLRLDLPALDWHSDVKGLQRFARDEPLRHYRYRVLEKPNGGARVLEIPKPRTKALQRRILREILDRIPRTLRPTVSCVVARYAHLSNSTPIARWWFAWTSRTSLGAFERHACSACSAVRAIRKQWRDC